MIFSLKYSYLFPLNIEVSQDGISVKIENLFFLMTSSDVMWRHPGHRTKFFFFQKIFQTILGKVREFGYRFYSHLKVINNDMELRALWTPPVLVGLKNVYYLLWFGPEIKSCPYALRLWRAVTAMRDIFTDPCSNHAADPLMVQIPFKTSMDRLLIKSTVLYLYCT